MEQRKPTIHDWAKDCAKLGRLAKNYAHANACLPNTEIAKAKEALDMATLEFSGRYAVPQDYAREIAITVADSVNFDMYIRHPSPQHNGHSR